MKTKSLVIMLILGICFSTLGGIIGFFEFSRLEFVDTFDQSNYAKRTYPLNPKLKEVYFNLPEIIDANYVINNELKDEVNLYFLYEDEPYLAVNLENNVIKINTDSNYFNNATKVKNRFATFISGLEDNKVYLNSLRSSMIVVEMNQTWFDRRMLY